MTVPAAAPRAAASGAAASPAAHPPVTLVGTTNAGPLAVADGRGGLQAVDGSWSLQWWVGADDRWHLPAEEAAVRQRLVEATPVVETAMRIPTGDAVATVFGTRVGGVADDLIALDVRNDSTLPFALALVLSGRSQVVVDARQAVIDATTEVRFARAPSRWAVGEDLAAVRDAVLGGEAVDSGAGTAGGTDANRGRVVAVLFPLAHTARLRSTVTVPAGRHGGGPVGAEGARGAGSGLVRRAAPSRGSVTGGDLATAAAPEADQVVRGWQAQLDRGLALRLPDDRLAGAVSLARAQVLLAAAGSLDGASVSDLALLAGVLAGQGFADESGAVVAHLAGRQRLTGRFGRGADARADTAAALQAFGDQWRLTHDRPLAESLVGPVAKAAHRIGKGGGDGDAAGVGAALCAAVDLLDGAGQPDAAQLVAALPAAPVAAAGGGDRVPLDRVPLDHVPLDRVLAEPGAEGVDPDRDRGETGPALGAGGARRPTSRVLAPDPPAPGTGSGAGAGRPDAGIRHAAALARFLAQVAAGLVDDGRASSTGSVAAPTVALFAGFPASWRGRSVEVHDAPTRFGLLSCAVRWHGERPALLWDLRPWPDSPQGPPVTLVAPALDPAWSAVEPRGEALLAASAPPDLEASFS